MGSDLAKAVADEILVEIRPIHFGRIEEGHASLMGCTNDRDAFVSVRWRAVVGADTHAPQSQCRDFQCSEFSYGHFDFSHMNPSVAPVVVSGR
jgi:hypothetical protein